jgi:hypothetical protein
MTKFPTHGDNNDFLLGAQQEMPDDILEQIAALGGPSKRRHKLPPGECPSCDREKGDFHPSHDASESCESGKHNHCTCDTCF